MGIIIIMTWSIWTLKNDWIFENKDPTVDKYKRKFVKEFSLLLHKANSKILSSY